MSPADLQLDGFLALPGLINAHDHLEFNLFPNLGRGPYPHAAAWAEDIYQPACPPIREHLRVPKSARLQWGGIKNLLCGVTTVAHHNPYEADVFGPQFPVRVVARYGWAHSLRFCADVAAERLRTPAAAPFIIHACEGTDEGSRDEVQRLDEVGALDAATVMVHGVALDGPGIELMQARRASLVWCPSSNYFILGGTLSHQVLDSGIPMALGTDSALTAAGDLIDELHIASRHAPLERLYRMVTTDAAKILRVTRDPGDWIVVRDNGQSAAEALLDLPPELVFSGGQLKLASAAWAGRLPPQQLRGFQSIEVEGRGRFLIDCDVSALAAVTRRILGDDFRLAGRRVAA